MIDLFSCVNNATLEKITLYSIQYRPSFVTFQTEIEQTHNKTALDVPDICL